MKKIIILILTTLAFSACNSAPQKDAKPTGPTYKIGYMICNSEKETIRRFSAFNAYLSKALNANFEMQAIDTTQFMNEIDTLHFTHTNSLLYIMMNQFNGVEILATEKKDSLGSKSQGVFIVRNDSEIKSIKDLKGKSVLFGPTLAPTGFMSQIDLLQNNGIDPENDLGFYTIPRGSFKHEKVVYGVLFERYDAGALPIGDIENMVNDNRIAEDDLRIIAKADPILYCNFAVTQKVDDKFAEKFKQVVLSITPETTVEYNGEVVKVLERALADGYEDAKNADFDDVREMAKRTNMPPYQKF
jgi:phosphate/phosphite/phosphonate ABC transporter binding protein